MARQLRIVIKFSPKKSYAPIIRYRVLGELLEQGTHSTLVIPSHRPNSTTLPAALPASLPPTVQNTAQNDPGMNASHALQHPGYYYHMAARYTEVRRERFLAALNAEVGIPPLESFWE